ncbi:hypothetical protein JRQ81_006730 [Phrynocephalus forsythii]|uniref:Uncharacterized protein n=1 Tax=Phrynocephalus forsythii TaxID=171643 RepID=A0A9Q0XFJ6_9SAUR|nr:hypothetical protein JRQ81_006730 [Phrynocephalus forsythii]
MVTGWGVQIQSSNRRVVYYTNKQGETHSLSLLHLTVQIWKGCYTQHVFLRAVHVASCHNDLADSSLSRHSQEWSLHQELFVELCHSWGMPAVDVFASRKNAKFLCTVLIIVIVLF